MSANPQIVMSAPPTPILDPESAWQQLVTRDMSARFFYAVTTTGVFCRPSCKSRLPLRANVRFFSSVEEAQGAGFRACKRCTPGNDSGNALEKVRAYIEAHVDRSVRLEQLGRIAGMSPFTVQRIFKRAMGVSPLQYQRALRAGSLRTALRQGNTVTDAIYEAGFGSSSRAYEGAQGREGRKNRMGLRPLPIWLGDCRCYRARSLLVVACGHTERSGSQLARRVS
jgi:AraC family transcriptional regulator of adaptative response/methylated-DNA-[protein]-cysteine methyltransferase